MKMKPMKAIGCMAVIGALVLAACDQTPGPANTREPEYWETWEEEEEEPAKLVGINLEPPDTLIYALGQAFDPTGMVVEGIYDDGTTNPLTAPEYTIDTPDTSVAATKVVTVKATEGDFTKRFQITVRNDTKILRSIAITHPPSKTAFELGQDLSTAGMVVTGDFYDSASETQSNETITAYKTTGYSKLRRGTQSVTVSANGKKAAPYDVTVKVPASATVNISFNRGNHSHFLKGQAFRVPDIIVRTQINGLPVNFGPSDLSVDDFSGYSSTAGQKTLTLTLDEKIVTFNVHVLDAEPEVYFDYGYMRLPSDPTGKGPGAAKYYAQAGERLTLSVARFLIGYDANNQDLGVTYSWSVSGGAHTATGGTGEFFNVTPEAAGTTYTINVSVTGRDYITGHTITKTAATELVCYSGTVPAQSSFTSPLKNFAPGQFTSGGNGYGWSLGAQGGYEVLRVDQHKESYQINGNAFGTWCEAGVVWMMEDKNNNNIPDEMWYELKGGEDDTNPSQITRRYAVKYFHAAGEVANEYGQPVTGFPWVDSKGRTSTMEGGWPRAWGVSDSENWVMYTGTTLRDDGRIGMGEYSKLAGFTGYVDAGSTTNPLHHFPISKARRADGTPISLTNVKFIKVQTAVFLYGGIFGEVSTEVGWADGLGTQTDFPLPSGAY